MRNLFLLLIVTLVSAPAALAQQDYGDWEFFVGYAHERVNNGADRLDRRGLAILPNGATRRVDFVSEKVPLNGVTGEVVANVHRHIGLVTNFAGTWGSTDYTDALTGQRFDARISRYTLLFGPRFNFRNSSRFIPFAHALFGISRQSTDFDDDNFSCPDTDDGINFAMAAGAGLDIRANDLIDIRPIQVDYIPVFYSNRRDDSIRFSAGVKFKTN